MGGFRDILELCGVWLPAASPPGTFLCGVPSSLAELTGKITIRPSLMGTPSTVAELTGRIGANPC